MERWGTITLQLILVRECVSIFYFFFNVSFLFINSYLKVNLWLDQDRHEISHMFT